MTQNFSAKKFKWTTPHKQCNDCLGPLKEISIEEGKCLYNEYYHKIIDQSK